MKKKIKILILGADGFLGSNLAKSLVQDGKYKIRAFDLFEGGVLHNLRGYENKIEVFSGNFLNRADLKKALKGIDYVFHYISLTTPGSSMKDPLIDVDTNIRGTVVLLEECVKAKIKKFIFSSSGGAIYGNQNKKSLSEEDIPAPISPYAISKLTIEKYLEYYRINHGFGYLIIRYSNPYGPGQNVVGSQGIIPIFLNLIKQNKPITVFGDGQNVRDYIFINDAIKNTKKLAFKKKIKHRLYNSGKGEGTTINEVIDTMRKVTGKKVKIKKMPARSIDVRRVVLDARRLKNEIDYSPVINLEEGIRKTWKWVNRNKPKENI
ncbi:MAG: NAD-dependent epimerase/dehydratase family protein [Patescibacteria group bacterium]|nr:NAD-dependent epimerase/dehydratase family protein [Patescibacteria group bacterium]